MTANQNDMTRREAIKLGLAGAAAAYAPLRLHATRRTFAPPPTAPARSVIQIWLWGGPSHLDTFDPKPDAGYDYTGPLNNPIPTNVPGIRIGQLLPKLARIADSYTLIRTMTHGINAHETASYRLQTGFEPDRIVRPCLGALVAKMKGYEQGYEGLVPPYIVLTQPQGRFSEQGFLGPDYKPFATGGNPNSGIFAVEGIVSPGISDERQHARRKLLDQLDTFGRENPDANILKAFDAAGDAAYETMFGDARKLFDLNTEPDAVRERYGRNTFGQSCLMARRLVEHGVPYVTVNYNGWDTHKGHFNIMQRKLPELDSGLSALLEELKQRGLLDSTIVWCGGEFGRGPKVQWEAPWNGGRSHYGACFSALLAGGGFKGGSIVGSSDEKGLNVATRPVLPENLLGSICQRMGIDPSARLENPYDLDLRVMDDANAGDGMLTEIM
jgi:hypothetical protein